MAAVLTTSGDCDVARLRVNAVLDKFRNGLKRIVLRKRDDGNRIPVIADLELAPRSRLCFSHLLLSFPNAPSIDARRKSGSTAASQIAGRHPECHARWQSNYPVSLIQKQEYNRI